MTLNFKTIFQKIQCHVIDMFQFTAYFDICKSIEETQYAKKILNIISKYIKEIYAG